jgi:hypothetical protein
MTKQKSNGSIAILILIIGTFTAIGMWAFITLTAISNQGDPIDPGAWNDMPPKSKAY